jgi:phosphoglycolate phosphatase
MRLNKQCLEGGLPAVVVLDLDGTLIDSAADLRTAVNAVLANAGRAPLDLPAVARMIGDGPAKLVERAFAATGAPAPPEALPALTEALLAVYLDAGAAHATRPFPGVPETLERLAAAGCRLAVCTNKSQGATEEVLRRLGLDRLFGAIVGGDRPARKPDPAHVLAALALLDASPAEAVMVGDSLNDVRAGRAAGLPVVAVSWGYGPVPAAELGADALIDRFADVPEAVARVHRERAAVR